VLQRTTWFLLLLLTAFVLVSGCSRQPVADTTPTPPAPALGYIDMQKALQAHPKYQELEGLQKQLTTLIFQIEQQGASAEMNSAVADGAGLQEMAGQEFQARMAAKEAAVNARLEATANQRGQTAATEMKAYEEEINRTFQPQIFNIQLKIRTLQLSKEELAGLQQQLDKLGKERSDRLSAQEQQQRSRMETALAPDKAAAGRELETFAGKLHEELAAKQAAQTAGMEQRAAELGAGTGLAGDSTDLRQQAERKQQEITALQVVILQDVQDKAAKVAAEQNMDTVLTHILVNVSATDITAKVVAEFKKMASGAY
jgi:hypothetical protein